MPNDDIASTPVTLTKTAPSVSLVKPSGVLRVNLRWNARPAVRTGGRFRLHRTMRSGKVDLDVGCLYEFTDGEKGAVQSVGDAFSAYGDFTDEPVITLDGDDRTGGRIGGENLSINLAYSSHIARVLVFAMIYEGVRNWAAAEAVVTIHPQASAPVEIRLDESDPRAPICAIALIENVNGELRIRREMRYVRGSQRTLDELYGWGMQWESAHK